MLCVLSAKFLGHTVERATTVLAQHYTITQTNRSCDDAHATAFVSK